MSAHLKLFMKIILNMIRLLKEMLEQILSIDASQSLINHTHV